MYPWHDCLEVIRNSMSLCWTRWRVGAWLMNFCMTQMSEQNKTNYVDGTLKRVHTEEIDSSSDDEWKTNNVKKSKVISLKV